MHAAALDQLSETAIRGPFEPDNPTRPGGKKETTALAKAHHQSFPEGRELILPAFWRGQRTPFEPLPIRSSWAYMSRRMLGIEEYLAPQRAPTVVQGHIL